MIEETAIVESVNHYEVGIVTTRNSACGGCQQKDGCSTSVVAKFFGEKKIHLKVSSQISVDVGDEVIIGVDEKQFLTLTLLTYLVPILGLFMFALLGQWYSNVSQADHEFWIISFGFVGFVAGVLYNKLYMKHSGLFRYVKPVLLKKIT